MKGGGQPFAALTVGSRAVGKRKTLDEILRTNDWAVSWLNSLPLKDSFTMASDGPIGWLFHDRMLRVALS
jgi:hypothetical protein